MEAQKPAATPGRLEPLPGPHAAGTAFAHPAASRKDDARLPVTPLVLTGAVGGGLLFALVVLRLFMPADRTVDGPLNEQAVRDWLLAVSAVLSFGFALLAYERHRALVAARRAERNFRGLYDSISEGVFRFSLDGRVISANPALVRLSGHEDLEEFVRACNDTATGWYVDPNRRAEIYQMLLKKGVVTNVVSEVYRHKTRERIWVEESVHLVRNKKTGEPLYYEGNVREVTETRRRLALQDRYDKIASIMSGCLYQHRRRADGSYCMPYASIGLYHIFGVKPEEVTEDTSVLRKRIHQDDTDRVAASLDYSSRTLTPWQCEYRICPEGIEKWVFAHAVPEREADGATLWHGYIVDVSERKHSEAKIYELAYFDPLTRLPNRASLRERLRDVLSPPNEEQSTGALLIVDVDHFKVLNDTKGHQVGDQLLCEVAQRICACVGPDTLIARIGGDEFVVLQELDDDAEGGGEAQVHGLGERILSAIDQPFDVIEDRFQTTASIGAVLFSGVEQNFDDVLKQAEMALYEAKAAGRGRLCFFEEQMQIAASDRLALTSDLRQAHREGTFALHYQPLVDGNGRCTGAEALIRWNHPVRGLINAGDFIPLAERNGFMGSIDNWVLKAACATLKDWQEDQRSRHLQLAINVSAYEMNRMEFVDIVKDALEESGARADRLTLELTEHVMLDDIDVVTAVMAKLQALGLHFALDDFGTGYSSLSYLKRLPIDTLKIDKSFVRDIESDQSDREIVQTILNVARSLKIPVIAEGVETELQAVLLRQLGCQGFQGYLFGKPLPLEDFTAFLHQHNGSSTASSEDYRRSAQS